MFKVDELPPYLLGQVANQIISARKSGRDIIDLSQVTPDIPPPAMAVDLLVSEVLRDHNHRYSASRGISRLREAVVSLYQSRFGLGLDPETEVIATMGTKEGLGSLLTTIIQPGDKVLIPSPCYPTYRAQALLAGAEVVEAELGLTGTSADLEPFLKAIQTAYKEHAPRVAIVNFPCNPTTLVAGRSFYESLIRLSRDNGVTLINDHTYLGWEFDDWKSVSLLEGVSKEAFGEKRYQGCVELFSLSKGFRVPGWRIGFAIGCSETIEALYRMKSYSDFGIFQALQVAGSRILDNHESVLAETSQIFQSRRDILTEALESIGWCVTKSFGSPFVWAKCPEGLRDLGSLALSSKLLEEASVACLPGEGFSEKARDYVRFSLAATPDRLRRAADSLAKISPSC